MTEQSTQDTRPQTRLDLARLVDEEMVRRLGGDVPDGGVDVRVVRAVALDVAWAEVKQLQHERDNAIDVVLDELNEEAAGEEPTPRPFPLRPDLHAARLLARPDLVSALRELYAVLLEAYSWDRRTHPREEMVAAYVNDIANAAADQTVPTVLWPVEAEAPAVDGELAELRVLRDDVARLLGIGPDGRGRIERCSILASLTRCVSIGGVAGDRTWDLKELRDGVARALAEIDDMPCLHGECPGPVEPSPKPRCSLCHTRMALRGLLADAPPGQAEARR